MKILYRQTKISLGVLTLWYGLLIVVLTGCLDNNKEKLRPTQLQSAYVGKLTTVTSQQQLGLYIRNGLLAQASQQPVYTTFESPVLTLSADASSGFSSSNVQVNGVDESDRIRYDGSHLYIAEEPQVYYPWTVPLNATDDANNFAKIRVMSTQQTPPTASEVNLYPLTEAGVSIEGMYQSEQGAASHLSVVTSNYPDVWAFDMWFDPWFWDHGRTGFHQLNVSDPGNIEEIFKLEIEGHLIDSRRVGDNVYLVTRFTPSVDGLIYFPQTFNDKLANQRIVDSLSINDLLPKVRLNGQNQTQLLDSNDCYIPQNTQTDEGYATLVTVTTINLNSLSVNSHCVGAYSHGIFASTSGIYLLSSGDQQTALHKFVYAGADTEYADTAIVSGDLGFRNPSFRVGEFNHILSVLSTSFESDQSGNLAIKHQLSLFNSPVSSAQGFTLISTLPNETNPQPIGKPGEDIYAVRYLEDRAYAVTFERIDPLYIFDLSNPTVPRIAAELEVNGFSDYLHPLGSTHLLGIGYDVDPTEPGLTLSVKLELFDVSDINAPFSVDSLLLGKRGSSSEVSYDHHAFSILKTGNEQYRIAIPRQNHSTLPAWGNSEDPTQWYDWTDFGLQLVTVETGSNSNLYNNGAVITESITDQSYSSYAWHTRSVLHDNAVYFSYNNQVWSADWNNPENVFGPF